MSVKKGKKKERRDRAERSRPCPGFIQQHDRDHHRYERKHGRVGELRQPRVQGVSKEYAVCSPAGRRSWLLVRRWKAACDRWMSM